MKICSIYCNKPTNVIHFSTKITVAAYYKRNMRFPTNVITITFAGIYYVCGDVKIFIVITFHKYNNTINNGRSGGFMAYKYLIWTDLVLCIRKMLLVNEDHLSHTHTHRCPQCCASLRECVLIKMSRKQQQPVRRGLTWRKWILGCFGFLRVSELISALIHRP